MRYVAGLLVALAFLAAAPAGANIAAVTRVPGTVGGAPTGSGTPLVVEEERLTFDCAPGRGMPGCSFEAVYLVHNPTDEPQDVLGAFVGALGGVVTIHVDGREVSRELTEAECERLDAAILAERESPTLERMVRDDADHWGLELSVPPGGRSEIVAAGGVMAVARFVPETWHAASETRHLLLTSEIGGPGDARFDARYLLAPLDTWAETRQVTIVVHWPAEWGLDAALSEEPIDGVLPEGLDGAWEVTEADGRRTATLRLRGRVPAVLELGLFRPGTEPLTLGGVTIGIGSLLEDQGGRFWMRWGYEIAYPDWLLHSIVVDTDYESTSVLALQFEAATPLAYLPVFPSLDAGIGIPVQMTPVARVGLRLLCGLSWGPVGFSATFDLYPGLDPGDEDFLQIGLLALILV